MSSKMKRLLSLTLSLILLFSVFPAPALADDGGAADSEHVHEYVFVPADAETREHYVCAGCDALFIINEFGEYIEAAAEDLAVTPDDAGADACGDDKPVAGPGISANESYATVTASGTCGDGVSWSLNDGGDLTISGNGAMSSYSSGTAPWYGKVISIKRVYIKSGITNIGSSAFYGCSNLIFVAIPDSVTSIGAYAFYGCKKLTSVTIPDKLTVIDGFAFYGCTALTEVTVPDSVEIIGDNTFCGCSRMTSVTLPDKLISLGNYVFSDCCSLSSVTIPDGVKGIGAYAFNGCTGLNSVTIPDSATFIGSYAFYGCSGLTAIDIPDSVTGIGSEAFYGCTGLSSVTIPGSVTSMGSYAFYGCTGLSSVSLSARLTTINSFTFSGCTGLSSVTIPGGITGIGSNAFSGCTGLSSVTIPDGVTSIGSLAFADCSALESIFLPASVKTFSASYYVEYSAFYGCSDGLRIYSGALSKPSGWGYFWNYVSYSSAAPVYYGYARSDYDFWQTVDITAEAVVIPEGVTAIPDRAFSGRTDLKSIILPESLRSIGAEAFSGCTGLRFVYIPAGVETITAYGASAGPFFGCDKSLKLYCGALSAPKGWSPFWCSVSDTADMKAVFGCTAADALFWNSYDRSSEIIIIPDGVSFIAADAFSACPELKAVYIPDSVKSIYAPGAEKSPFTACSREVTIYADNLPNVYGWGRDWNVLTDGTALTVKTGYSASDCLFWYAFPAPEGEVVIPDGAEVIPSDIFAENTEITSVAIPAGVRAVNPAAFSGCTGLTEVRFGGSACKIAGDSFAEVTATVYYPCNDESWDSFGFGSFGGDLAWLKNHNTVTDEYAEPACGKPGLTEGSHCDICGEVFLAQEIIPAPEHEFENGVCGLCGLGIRIEGSGDTEIFGEQKLQLGISYLPEGAKETAVKWSIAEGCAAWASVTQDGLVTLSAADGEYHDIIIRALTPEISDSAATYTVRLYPMTHNIAVYLDGGDVSGGSIEADMAVGCSLSLEAVTDPAGACRHFVWRSEDETVASVSEDGTVTLLKPGETDIAVSTTDGSELTEKVHLKVYYLTDSEAFRAGADTKLGKIFVGEPVEMLVYDDDGRKIAADMLSFAITSENPGQYASIDDNGFITALVPGKIITVMASLRDDPLGRGIVLQFETAASREDIIDFSCVNDGLMRYFDASGAELPSAEGASAAAVYLETYADGTQSFIIRAEQEGIPLSFGRYTYKSDNTKIGTVKENSDGSATVTILKNASGAFNISAAVNGSPLVQGSLRIVVMNCRPELSASKVTLNCYSYSGANIKIWEKYDTHVSGVSISEYDEGNDLYLPSSRFAVTYDGETGNANVTPLVLLKNGSYTEWLEISTGMGDYRFKLTVNVSNSKPKITVKQASTVNLFYFDACTELKISAGKYTVTDVTLDEALTYELEPDDGTGTYILRAVPLEDDEGLHCVNTGTMYVTLEESPFPVEQTIVIKVKNKAPSLSVKPGKATLRPLDGECSFSFSIYDSSSKAPLELEDVSAYSDAQWASVDIGYENEAELYLEPLYDDSGNERYQGGTARIWLTSGSWRGSASVSLTVKVVNTPLPLKPSFKLKKTSASLSLVTPDAEVCIGYTASGRFFSPYDVRFASTAKEGSAAREEADKIYLDIDEDGIYVSASPYDFPKAGRYSFKVMVSYDDEYGEFREFSAGTLTVAVSTTLPAAKLSKAALNLNIGMPDAELSTLLHISGHKADVTDVRIACKNTGVLAEEAEKFEFLIDYCGNYYVDDEERVEANVTVGFLSADDLPMPGTYTFALYATAANFVKECKPVTLKVVVTDAVPKVKAAGKANVLVRSAPAITYTVTNMSAISGEIIGAELSGRDAELFSLGEVYADAKGKTCVDLALIEGTEYDLRTKYKIAIVFITDTGDRLETAVQTVTLTQSSVKASGAPKSFTISSRGLRSQTVSYTVSLSSPTGAKVESIRMGSVGSAFRKSLSATSANVSWHLIDDDTVVVTVTFPDVTALGPGKKYTLPLVISPANDVNPTSVKIDLTLNVRK